MAQTTEVVDDMNELIPPELNRARQNTRRLSSYDAKDKITIKYKNFLAMKDMFHLSSYQKLRSIKSYLMTVVQHRQQLKETWLYHQYEPLPDTLTDISFLKRKVKKLGLNCFLDIQKYMGDRESTRRGRLDAAQQVIKNAVNNELVRNEIFVQLIKQTTRNKSLESNLFGWKLLYMLLMACRPSKGLDSCVMSHVAREAHSKPPVDFNTLTTNTLQDIASSCFDILMGYDNDKEQQPEHKPEDFDLKLIAVITDGKPVEWEPTDDVVDVVEVDTSKRRSSLPAHMMFYGENNVEVEHIEVPVETVRAQSMPNEEIHPIYGAPSAGLTRHKRAPSRDDMFVPYGESSQHPYGAPIVQNNELKSNSSLHNITEIDENVTTITTSEINNENEAKNNETTTAVVEEEENIKTEDKEIDNINNEEENKIVNNSNTEKPASNNDNVKHNDNESKPANPPTIPQRPVNAHIVVENLAPRLPNRPQFKALVNDQNRSRTPPPSLPRRNPTRPARPKVIPKIFDNNNNSSEPPKVPERKPIVIPVRKGSVQKLAANFQS